MGPVEQFAFRGDLERGNGIVQGPSSARVVASGGLGGWDSTAEFSGAGHALWDNAEFRGRGMRDTCAAGAMRARSR